MFLVLCNNISLRHLHLIHFLLKPTYLYKTTPQKFTKLFVITENNLIMWYVAYSDMYIMSFWKLQRLNTCSLMMLVDKLSLLFLVLIHQLIRVNTLSYSTACTWLYDSGIGLYQWLNLYGLSYFDWTRRG